MNLLAIVSLDFPSANAEFYVFLAYEGQKAWDPNCIRSLLKQKFQVINTRETSVTKISFHKNKK
jgi:hypothetical protein